MISPLVWRPLQCNSTSLYLTSPPSKWVVTSRINVDATGAVFFFVCFVLVAGCVCVVWQVPVTLWRSFCDHPLVMCACFVDPRHLPSVLALSPMRPAQPWWSCLRHRHLRTTTPRQMPASNTFNIARRRRRRAGRRRCRGSPVRRSGRWHGSWPGWCSNPPAPMPSAKASLTWSQRLATRLCATRQCD